MNCVYCSYYTCDNNDKEDNNDVDYNETYDIDISYSDTLWLQTCANRRRCLLFIRHNQFLLVSIAFVIGVVTKVEIGIAMYCVLVIKRIPRLLSITIHN